MAMKCQKCDRPATFHITELTGGKPHELHLCEEHAREYLTQSDGQGGGGAPSLAGALAQQMAVSQTAEELARLDQQACPVCGIMFYEFRNKGRLGCPHDYVCFENELATLLLNIHGATEHTGKRPVRASGSTDDHTALIRLRREMKEAVDNEEYERASQIRDEIRTLKQETQP